MESCYCLVKIEIERDIKRDVNFDQEHIFDNF